MNIENLSNLELTERIEILRGKERAIVLKFLLHLGEFDKRKLYLEQGYSSLFDFCVRKLGYSEGSAYRRVESALCLRDHPELEESFLNGEVTICTIANAARAIKKSKTNINEIIGKSAREVEAIVAELAPVSKPKEVIKEIKVETRNTIPMGPLFTQSSDSKPSQDKPETRFELKFSVSEDVYREIQAIKSNLSNKLGRNLNLENVLIELVNKFRDVPKPRKVVSINENSRKPSALVKREVLRRDGCQCTFVSSDGVRCTEKHYLHLDHVQPFALGGRSSKENLRVLCSKHNQMLSQKTFGKRDFAKRHID